MFASAPQGTAAPTLRRRRRHDDLRMLVGQHFLLRPRSLCHGPGQTFLPPAGNPSSRQARPRQGSLGRSRGRHDPDPDRDVSKADRLCPVRTRSLFLGDRGGGHRIAPEGPAVGHPYRLRRRPLLPLAFAAVSGAILVAWPSSIPGRRPAAGLIGTGIPAYFLWKGTAAAAVGTGGPRAGEA